MALMREWPSTSRGTVLIALLTLSFGLAFGDFLPCTYEDCPVCLDTMDKAATVHNLTFVARDGNSYQSPVRIGRPDQYWDSHSLIASVFGILVKERLGVDVAYVANADEVLTCQALLGCLNWTSYFSLRGLPCVLADTLQDAKEAVRVGWKQFADPLPDIFISLEQWPTPMVNRSAPKVEALQEYGSIGFVSEYALRVKLATCEAAWEHGRVVLRDFRAYRESTTASYFTHLSITMVDPDIVGKDDTGEDHVLKYCPGNPLNSWDASTHEYYDKYLKQQDFSCDDSLGEGVALWRSSACAGVGLNWTSECTPVIIYTAIPAFAPIFDGINISQAKMVVLTVRNFETFFLFLDRYDSLWLWWSTDAQHYQRRPQLLRLDESTAHITVSSTVPLKTVWSPFLRVSKSLQILLQQFLITSQHLDSMLTLLVQAKDQGEGPDNIAQPGFFRKVACDWMRDNPDVWHSFLPDPRYCEDGQFFNDDLVGCTSCPPGTSWIFSGSVASCVPCVPGKTQPEAAQLSCLECVVGTASNATSLRAKPSECPSCSRGFYSSEEGSTACAPCDPGQSTLLTGSTKKEDCQCAAGWYNSALFPETAASGSVCMRCASTMVCNFGQGLPRALPGFYADSSAPLSLFRCGFYIDESPCQGGPLGNTSCSGLRRGFLCAQCPEGLNSKGVSECVPCSAEDRTAVALVFIALVAACGLMVMWSRRQTVTSHPATLSAAGFFSQLLTCLQVFSAIASSGAQWGAPLQGFYNQIQFFSLNIKEIVNLGCVGFADPIVDYCARMIGPMCCCALAFLGVSVVQCALRRVFVSTAVVVNVLGQVFLAVYISIALASLLPYHIFQHPNGFYSLVSDPSVLCWSTGTHSAMIVISVVSLLVYVVGIKAVVFYAILRYPIKIIKDDVRFMKTYSFIFFRVAPHCYYFPGIWLIRNCLIALLPMVIPAEDAFIALFAMVLVFLISLALTAALWPWRSASMNLSDVVLHIPTTALMVAGAMATTSGQFPLAFVIVLSIFLLGSISLLCTLLLWSVAERFVMSRRIDIFLSHHKVGGGCMARYLKVVFSQYCRTIFLDSDNLSQLYQLLDAVKNSKLFLVLLTGEVLSRPWCGGEIVTAHQCGIPFACCANGMKCLVETADVLVARNFDRFYTLLGQEVEDVLSGFSVLGPYGIVVESVASAYDFLSNLRTLYFELWDQEQMLDACSIVARMIPSSMGTKVFHFLRLPIGSSNTYRGSGTIRIERKIPPAAMLCDPKDREAVASARFIAEMLRQVTQQEISLSPCFSTDPERNDIEILLVCMGEHVIHDKEFLTLLFQVYGRCPKLGLIPVRLSDRFSYPDSEYYQNLAIEFDCGGMNISVYDILTCVHSLFETIAVLINVGWASQDVLDASIKGLLERITSHQRVSCATPKLSSGVVSKFFYDV